MVSSCDDEIIDISRAQRSNGWFNLRLQSIAIGSLACVTLVIASVFLATQENPAISLNQVPAKTQKLYDATTFDELSGDLLGGLEKAMDNSVDNKVRSFMAAPSLAAVPVPHVSVGYHRLLPFDPHPYVTQTQLERLLSEKRELERKRESILRTLRMRREAAAAKAAKDAAELDQVRLERAVTEAKKRQLEQAQRAARAAAARLREAAVAKKLAIHAAAVAAHRQNELEEMSLANTKEAMHVAKAEEVQDSADDMQYQQDKSVVDSKLQHYLAQERDLLHKIAAAEKVAAHGGQWPADGMPRSQAAPKRVFVQEMAGAAVDEVPASKKSQTEQLQQVSNVKANARGGIENTVIDSIVRTMKNNKLKLAHDNVEAQDLGKEQQSLIRQMSELRAADRRLTKELVHAELQRRQA
eukprot:CAMPEP_0172172600 /NCGR_PEP_ID=MMETSP1050-20130122/12540_1 /TAXON_ID=233186 /ORGANISM="Cryptomonas curvata, Strain CCAP979/52" /LENGTH=411 /DNA_ID=CAMNT_0012844165 /DNA_START=57 /DNA_END=1292 /DNA_ORIENTATION=-